MRERSKSGLTLLVLGLVILPVGVSAEMVPLIPPRKVPKAAGRAYEPPRKPVKKPSAYAKSRGFKRSKKVSYWRRKKKVRMPEVTRGVSASTTAKEKKGGSIIGFELGGLGRKNDTDADVLGVRFLYGGRLFSVFSLGKRFYLKPAAGFFFRRDSEGNSSVTEYLVEAGAELQYNPGKSGRVRWMLGVAARGELSWSSISLPNSETVGDNPRNLRMRLGPTAGFTIPMGRRAGFLFNTEVSFPLVTPVQPNYGLVVGILFR